MIHELSLFLCRDEESGRAFFAVREDDGSLSYVEPETLLSVKMPGSGPFPVMMKADDLKVEQDMKKLYGRHQACGAHKKVLTGTPREPSCGSQSPWRTAASRSSLR